MIGVCIVTYNQEDYIAKAIDSVLLQKDCQEGVLIYIGNDCSTDRTTEICNSYAALYPDRIRLFNNPHNLGLVENTLSILQKIQNDNCEYIAMLDGDDYWCDELKLYKQAAFLDSHPDYGYIQGWGYLLTDSGLKKPKEYVPPIGNVFDKMGSFPIGGSSAFFRCSLLKFIDFDDFKKQGFLSLDYVMYVIFSAHTLFGFLPEYLFVWRRNVSSISNPQNKEKQIAYLQNDRAMWQYLGRLFPERFFFDEASWEKYYNKKVFQIAFRFKDYQLAHQVLPVLKREQRSPSLKMKMKMICAMNKVLFLFFTSLHSFIQQ